MTRPQSLPAITVDQATAVAHPSQYKVLAQGHSPQRAVTIYLMQVYPGYQPDGPQQWRWTDGYYCVGWQVGQRTHGKAFARDVHGARRAGIYFNALASQEG